MLERRYEAEYAVIEGENTDAALGYSGFVRARGDMSNGYVLVRISRPGNKIIFTVTSDKAEENVTLTACIAMLQYGNPWKHRQAEFDSAYTVSVNDVNFPQTGVMFGSDDSSGDQYFRMVEVPLTIDLAEGENDITFTVPEPPPADQRPYGSAQNSYIGPNFDYITITTSSAKLTYKQNYDNAMETMKTVLTGITVSGTFKNSYIAGETFDKTGMTVTAKYSDGTSKEVTDYTISPEGALGTEDSKVTVSYTEDGVTKTADVAITVMTEAPERFLQSIAVTTPPDKTAYIAGEWFDPTGMVVVAVYDDGSEQVVTDYTIEPSDGLPAGTESVTIRHNGFTATQPVTVTADEVLERIVVTGVPQTELAVGDDLPAVSENDITVTAYYFSGSSKQLSEGEYTLDIPTGKAQLGSAVIATLTDGSEVTGVCPFNVSSTINITSGMVTGESNYRGGATAASWAVGAMDNDFVQNCINDSIVTFTITSASDCNAVLTLRGASGWVLEYGGSNLPVNLGDMNCATMFDLEVNGQIVTIDPEAAFTGGEYGTPSNENLAKWSDAVLATVKLNEGENTIRLLFKAYSYVNGTDNTSMQTATPNLDCLTVTATA